MHYFNSLLHINFEFIFLSFATIPKWTVSCFFSFRLPLTFINILFYIFITKSHFKFTGNILEILEQNEPLECSRWQLNSTTLNVPQENNSAHFVLRTQTKKKKWFFSTDNAMEWKLNRKNTFWFEKCHSVMTRHLLFLFSVHLLLFHFYSDWKIFFCFFE